MSSILRFVREKGAADQSPITALMSFCDPPTQKLTLPSTIQQHQPTPIPHWRLMNAHDRVIRDSLFDDGFAKLARERYAEGFESLRVASGADHLVTSHGDNLNHGEEYSPATGISPMCPVAQAAKRGVNDDGVLDPAALVFMGSEAEFKGFIERRTGTSPDYRIPGYANHLGEAISFYREAKKLRFPVATERLAALELKLGSQDFINAERAYKDGNERAQAHLQARVQEILASRGPRESATAPHKQGRCYIATAVYGSYDCPEVRVLRRWRDATLRTSGLGRALVAVYYAVSPAFVDAFGNRSWLTGLMRTPLDLFVARLRRGGVDDSPYQDN